MRIGNAQLMFILSLVALSAMKLAGVDAGGTGVILGWMLVVSGIWLALGG